MGNRSVTEIEQYQTETGFRTIAQHRFVSQMPAAKATGLDLITYWGMYHQYPAEETIPGKQRFYHEERIPVEHETTVHHDAVTQWVVDTPVHWKCSVCGKTANDVTILPSGEGCTKQ